MRRENQEKGKAKSKTVIELPQVLAEAGGVGM
jgi:hypothetical protein